VTDKANDVVEPCRAHLIRQGFTLGRRLGSGAFGTVYQAQQGSLGRPVAVKLFTAEDFPVVPDDVERFRKEARLLSKVEHPSLPYVITVGEVEADGGRKVPYMVMQFIPGGSLDERLQKEKRLQIGTACELAKQLLGALDVLHHQDILHRDIKPNNILISGDRAVLVDFSLGVSLKYQPGLTRATKKGQGLGVREYAAPEQLVDAQSCDGRADLYSVGIVLFEMLAGHPRLDRGAVERQLGKGHGIPSSDHRTCLPSRPGPTLCDRNGV